MHSINSIKGKRYFDKHLSFPLSSKYRCFNLACAWEGFRICISYNFKFHMNKVKTK